jgi:glyoxylase-like metal-dependent hydrolase (beta-lactamase superfamily II)
MIFQQITSGGCLSYLVGCVETCAAAVIDPEISQIDRYLALASRDALRIRYLIDTHTHADHFSGTHELARQLQVPVGDASRKPGAVCRYARRRRRHDRHWAA